MILYEHINGELTLLGAQRRRNELLKDIVLLGFEQLHQRLIFMQLMHFALLAEEGEIRDMCFWKYVF